MTFEKPCMSSNDSRDRPWPTKLCHMAYRPWALNNLHEARDKEAIDQLRF